MTQVIVEKSVLRSFTRVGSDMLTMLVSRVAINTPMPTPSIASHLRSIVLERLGGIFTGYIVSRVRSLNEICQALKIGL